MEKRSYGTLVVAVIVALGAIIVALVTTSMTSAPESNDQDSSVAVVGTNRAATSGDADGDGVPDWKEILWSTDPYNADTDGDGVSDAEEIAIGADPLKEGSEPAPTKYTAPKALTPTEALSRELFAGYAELKQDGSLSSAEASAAVSESLLRNVQPQESARVYTLSDLSIESDVSLNAYENALVSAFQKTTVVREYELLTFTRVIQTENLSELQKIADAAAVYQEVVATLVAMEVPSSLANEHLSVVNSLSALTAATTALTTWNGDPLTALNLVNNFADKEESFANNTATLYALISNLQ